MRLTFIHDHKFIPIEGEYYSTGKFSSKVLSKYLVFPIDNIQFIGRSEENSYDVNSLVEASNDKIKINTMDFLNNKLHFITKRKAIKDFLKQSISKTDIVIIRFPSEIGYIAAELLEKEKISYGIELVGDPWDALWYHGSILGKLMAFTNKKRVKKHMSSSKNNMYVTKYYLQKKYPSKHNSFVASNVLISTVENNYMHNSKSPLKIGLIGSLDTKYKGIETALKSLSLIDEDFLFEVVGNGPQKKWKKRIKKYGLKGKVNLKGTLKQGEEITQWFSSLDLYVQPSYTEGLPRALIEAMSNGVPCLGSEAGGIPELLGKDYTHRVKDYKHFSEQIRSVLSSKELRKKMSEANLLTAQNYLNNKIQKNREDFIISIYEEHKCNEP